VAIPGLILFLVGLLLMGFFSLKGNVESSHLHVFILGALLLMVGLQGILTGFLMKTYSVVHGYENKAGIITSLMQYHNLEKFLLLGACLVLAGVLLGINIIIKWFAVSFGILSEISTAITALVLIVSGIQVVLFTVFQSMMLLNENNNHARV
jgi:hypothetical protein